MNSVSEAELGGDAARKIIYLSPHGLESTEEKASAIQILESIVSVTDKTEVHSACKAGRAAEYVGINNGPKLHCAESAFESSPLR